MPIPSEKDLLTAACHLGHPKTRWNPRMAPYLYGIRKGVHIFDLEQTKAHLEVVCDALEKMQKEGKVILFVSTKQQSIPLIENIGESLNQPTVTKKWIPGLMTNWSTIKQRLKYYLDLQKSFQSGEVEKYTKKERTSMRKKLAKLDIALSGVASMTKPPDAIFVLDAVRDYVAIAEARKLHIPVYGICDSNAEPSNFTAFIPANDDAVGSLTIIVETVQEQLGGKPVKKTTKEKVPVLE
ncbi:MAG: 30S ribosomal protein S2 [bacterium]|nr:30S ribosomal protein S2 [bacterium]